MNPKVRVALFLLGLAALSAVIFSLIILKNKGESNLKVAEQLLSYINDHMPTGTRFKVDWKNSIVEPTDNNRYYVTFKDMLFVSDATWAGKFSLKDLTKEDNVYPEEFNTHIEEFAFLYGPEDNYIKFLAMRGVSADADISVVDSRKLPWGGLDIKFDKYHAGLGELVCSGLDIGELFKKDKKNSREIMEQFLKGKQNPFELSMKDMEAGLRMVDENGKKTWIRIKVEKLENFKQGMTDPYTNVYLFKKNAPTPDLSEILQTGLPLVDLEIELGAIHISLEKDGISWGGGVIQGVSLGQYIKPNEARTRFNSGYTFSLKNAELSIPGNKTVELLSKITDCQAAFSVDDLSDGAILAWMDIVRKSWKLKDSADDSAMQEISIFTEKYKKEIIASKSPVKFSIAPLKHEFGELNAKAGIRLQEPFSFSEATMSIEVTNIDTVLEKLAEANLIPPVMAPQMAAALMMLGLVNENGSLSFTAETKPDEPGIVYVNGIPMPLPKFGP